MKANNKAIFLDRDGVINKVLLRKGMPFSPRTVNDFRLISGIDGVLRHFRKNGLLNIVITNQPDIARGFLKKCELNKMHAIIKKILPIDVIMVCPHDDKDHCSCRKPKPGMLFAAANKFNIELNKSFLIGDTERDVIAGRSAGCATIIIDTKYNKDVKADYRVRNLKDAIKIILNGRTQ